MNYVKDVSLYNEDGTVNVIIEICPGTSDKSELVEPEFNRLECVRQVEGIYPFYYGSFPQTYAGDKDPLDVILFTDKDHHQLDLVKVDVIGAVKTIDAGEQDDKLICVEADCGLTNLHRHMKKAMKFLKSYKGKNADMIIEKKLVSEYDAETLLEIAHRSYKEMPKKEPILKVLPKTTSVVTNNNSQGRVRVIRR